MASTWNTSTSWYSHPVYARYWQHYHHAMAWMHSHQHAYRKATESYFLSPWCFCDAASLWNPKGYQAEYPQAFDECHVVWQDSQYSSSHFEGPRQPSQKDQGSLKKGPGYHRRKTKAHSRKFHKQAVHEDKQIESGSDEIECDLSNMEITEELRQYFAETERHQEERRRQQQLDEKRMCDYVNADHGLYYSRRSMQPPCEPPGERRQAEMKRLYGDSAPKILAMEAAVQLNFDKHCDRKQPKYWPVIPLKF